MLDTRAQSGDGPSVRTDTHKREPTKATRAASVASLLFVVKNGNLGRARPEWPWFGTSSGAGMRLTFRV